MSINSKILSFMACGSAMYTRKVSNSKDPDFLKVVQKLKAADVSFMNFEGQIGHPDAYPIKPYSFASYFFGEKWIAKEYAWTGFNLTSLANNHMNDWSHEAIYESMKQLDKAGIVYAGAGMNLTAAREPGYLDTPNGRVALISIDSSHEQGEFVQPPMASDPKGKFKGRPGTNTIRYDVILDAKKETIEHLRKIRKELNLEKFRGREGDKDKHLFFPNGGNPGITFRESNEPGFTTISYQKDVDANLKWIKNAKEMADYVIVSHHTHANGNKKTGPYAEVPADFVTKFAHDAIDAGADICLFHGMHGKGIEIYKGKPIFYDLGWFSWMVETLPRFPYDLYDNWELDPYNSLPIDITNARPAGQFGVSPLWNQGFMFDFKMQNGKVIEIKLHPMHMGRHLPLWERGLPRIAEGKVAKEILSRQIGMSKELGTEIIIENDIGVVKL
ncbi:MAG: hypothetical protein HOF20_08955 [Pelagibacteraceae bacterium]|nr:hypothetical protein [Pelagibacteraceae bacterium]